MRIILWHTHLRSPLRTTILTCVFEACISDRKQLYGCVQFSFDLRFMQFEHIGKLCLVKVFLRDGELLLAMISG